jgi:uncharacterized membrane protein YkoI
MIMIRRRKTVVAGAIGAVMALGAGGAAIASSGGDDGDDGDVTVTGVQADRATKAALEVTGGGHANSVERDSENGATWEVEITKPEGDTVDVRLDAEYHLVVVEGDSGS